VAVWSKVEDSLVISATFPETVLTVLCSRRPWSTSTSERPSGRGSGHNGVGRRGRFGWLLSSLFADELQQLGLPCATRRGLRHDSRVVTVQDQKWYQLGAAWLRTLRSTGQTVYSGWYGTALLPRALRPSVRVMFPLPNGSVTVFLRPEVRSTVL